MAEKKKFGLVMPKKVNAIKVKKNIFDDDSDENENVQKRPKIPQKKIESKTKLNTDVVDPSIYEYDDIYDEMKRKQTETNAPKVKKNSRYIETLMKAAEKRQKEYQRRIDKKIQAEREKEGDKYNDKEAFVTSSYKKKMLEQEEEEEKERRENMLNDMMDVTKQKDLSGFYRHFLKQTVGEEKVPVFGDKQVKEEIVSNEDSSDNQKDLKKYDAMDKDSDSDSIHDSKSPESDEKSCAEKEKMSSDSENQDIEQSSDRDKSNTKKRSRKHYRTSRKSLSPSSSLGEKENYNVYNDKNLHSGTSKKSSESNLRNLHNSRHDSSDDDDHQQNGKSTDTNDCDKEKKETNNNIYAKRTVGDIFTEAQTRYFQRMAMKKAEI